MITNQPVPHADKLKLGYLSVLLGGMLWGTTGTAQALLPSYTNPLTVGALRLALGGFVLLVFVLLSEGFNGIKGYWPFGATLIAVIGMVGFQASFFYAVFKIGVAAGTMICAGSAPIFAGIMGYLLEHEKQSKIWRCSTFLAISGVVLLAAGKQGSATDITGIVLAVTAGIFYSLYGLGVKRITFTRSPTSAMAVILCIGSLLILPLYLLLDFSWLMTPKGLAIGMYLGLLATAVPYSLFAIGLSKIPISSAYTLSLSEPVTACLLGVVLLGEKLTLLMFCGIILIFTGLVLLTVPNRFFNYIRPAKAKQNETDRSIHKGFDLSKNNKESELDY